MNKAQATRRDSDITSDCNKHTNKGGETPQKTQHRTIQPPTKMGPKNSIKHDGCVKMRDGLVPKPPETISKLPYHLDLFGERHHPGAVELGNQIGRHLVAPFLIMLLGSARHVTARGEAETPASGICEQGGGTGQK